MKPFLIFQYFMFRFVFCFANQAQMLLSKNALYEAINQEINRLSTYQPTVFSVLPHQSAGYKVCCEEEDGPELPLMSSHRDVAISSLRFLSIFYNSGPNSFYVAANLMDCLLSKITVSTPECFFQFTIIYCEMCASILTWRNNLVDFDSVS